MTNTPEQAPPIAARKIWAGNATLHRTDLLGDKDPLDGIASFTGKQIAGMAATATLAASVVIGGILAKDDLATAAAAVGDAFARANTQAVEDAAGNPPAVTCIQNPMGHTPLCFKPFR